MDNWREIRDEDRDLDETWSFDIPATKQLYH